MRSEKNVRSKKNVCDFPLNIDHISRESQCFFLFQFPFFLLLPLVAHVVDFNGIKLKYLQMNFASDLSLSNSGTNTIVHSIEMLPSNLISNEMMRIIIMNITS